MKVLITGGYGFIGSHIADKFYREGHDVFIIDNLTRGRRENFSHKHRFYELSVEDVRCEEIFRNNRFDVVIHMAAQVGRDYGQKFSYYDTKVNVLGLVNLLQLSAKYGVKKFIFASSEEVYGESSIFPSKEDSDAIPTTVLGVNKLLGEYYCQKWKELFGLQTLSLRISQVYGPRQIPDEEEVVAILLEKLCKKEAAVLPGGKEQIGDYIYVEDVAEAVYRAYNINYSGVLNLSTAVKTTNEHLVEILEKFQPFSSIGYREDSLNGRRGFCLDNSLMFKVFDWIPGTNLEEGLYKTYQYTLRKEETKKKRGKGKSEKNTLGGGIFQFVQKMTQKKKWIPYFENVLAFFLLTLLSLRHPHMIEKLPVDLNLLLIITFAIIYGSRQAILAFILHVISNILIFQGLGRDPIVLMYSTDFYIKAAYYVFVAFLIGYVKDGLERQTLEKKENIRILDEKMEFLVNQYQDMRIVRDELQTQIVNSEDSFGKIFSIIQELDTLRPEEVFAKAISVLERLMKTEGVAIYRFTETSKFARLMACSAKLKDTLAKSIKIEENPEIINAMVKKDIYVSKELIEGRPIMVMPVLTEQNVVGSILLYKADFERLTLAYQNFFKVITDLVSSTLFKAYAYDSAIENEKYIEGTNILRTSVFGEMMKSKRSLEKIHKMNYVVLRIQLNGTSQKHAAEKIGGIIRDTDFMGIDSDGHFLLVLGNTNLKEAGFVIGRLIQLGLDAQVVEEGGKDE